MRFLAVLATLALAPVLSAAEVVGISWDSTHACEPVKLATGGDNWLPAFRASLLFLPESAVVKLSLSRPAQLGLSPEQAAALRPLVAERYRRIEASPVYSKAPSLLSYCFSDHKPAKGSANLYLPDHPTPASPVLVFLHGYGGSFLWYQHWLSEAFPDSIILCPAHGVSPAKVAPEYLSEAIAAASAKLGFPIKRPTLIGLSAGGFGACRAYTASPSSYSRLLCLASYPPEETVARFPNNSIVDFVAGSEEPFVKSGQLARVSMAIRRQGATSSVHLIPGGDHFFLLSHREASVEVMQRLGGTPAHAAPGAR